MNSVGIIGFGRFGKVLANILQKRMIRINQSLFLVSNLLHQMNY